MNARELEAEYERLSAYAESNAWFALDDIKAVAKQYKEITGDNIAELHQTNYVIPKRPIK